MNWNPAITLPAAERRAPAPDPARFVPGSVQRILDEVRLYTRKPPR